MNIKKKLIPLFLIVLSCLILECFVFNYNFFKNYKNEELEITDFKVTDSTYKDGEIIASKKTPCVEMNNINVDVKNIYLDIECDNPVIKYDGLEVYFYCTAFGMQEYFPTARVTMFEKMEESKQVFFNICGGTKKIKFELLNSIKDTRFEIKRIVINKNVPYDFTPLRLMLCIFLGIFLYIIRPKSSLYKYKLNLKRKKQQYVIVGVCFLQCMFFLFLCLLNGELNAYSEPQHVQYQELAKSLKKGKVSLDKEPSEKLKGLENPYDATIRERKLLINKDYSFDNAYYNGKYYVYFGVIPEVLTFLPYYLLTGRDMPNFMAVWIFGIIFILAVFGLINQISKRYFKNTSFLLYILICFLFINGSGMIYFMKMPVIYVVPHSGAIAFIMMGLYLFMKAFEKREVIYKRYIFLGSISICFVAGCRPQLLICSLLLIPLLWKDIIKERNIFKKQYIAHWILLLIPILMIGGGLMTYNFIRFNNSFDFGANYNLTTNDLTNRYLGVERVPDALFYYFLKPPELDTQYPFLQKCQYDVKSDFNGVISGGTIIGGLLSTNLILLACFLIFPLKRFLKEKRLYGFCVEAMICSVAICLFDAFFGGLYQRHIVEMAFLWFIVLSIVLLQLEQMKKRQEYKTILRSIFIFGMVLCIGFNLLTIIHPGPHSLAKDEPFFFYKIKYFFM